MPARVTAARSSHTHGTLKERLRGPDWGNVLTKQGHGKEALAKYDEALKYAPNWAALKDAHDAAAKHAS